VQKCAVAVLLKDKLARILTCCRQQLYFLNQTCLLLLILLLLIFDIVCNYYPTIFLYKLKQFHKKTENIFTEEVKAFIKICTLL